MLLGSVSEIFKDDSMIIQQNNPTATKTLLTKVLHNTI